MKYEIHKAFVGVGAAVIAISLIVLVVRMNLHEHPLVGTRILPALNVHEVANIECDGQKLASHHDGNWVIDAYDGYPADPTKVDSFLCALTNLTVWKVEEDTNICRRVMYNPLSIVLKDVDGNVLADLELGEKHGVGHSGFVESVFVPDGRYMSFMGETVVVREQFRMFWGHGAEIRGLGRNWIDPIPSWRMSHLQTNATPIVISVTVTGNEKPMKITERLSYEKKGNGWSVRRSFEIEGMRQDETVNIDRVKSFMASLRSIGFYDVKRAARFSDANRNNAKAQRSFMVEVSDGKNPRRQKSTVYDCGDACYVEMQGWIYTVHRFEVQDLLISREDLLKGDNR